MSTANDCNTPITRRVRAYFAPVDRVSGTPTLFDPAQTGRFDLDAPPAPWRDLGWCLNFRRSDADGITAVRSGPQAMVTSQLRSAPDATLALEFATWGKLQLALSSGSQQMNLLPPATGSATVPSGGDATAAVALDPSSTAAALVVGPTLATAFHVGDLVVVDADYAAQTGFLGTGVSGGYVRTAADVRGIDYIRRISLNVARIASITGGTLTLDRPLPAGVPAPGMKLSRVTGFVDREGSAFFQEWSALFVLDGELGDRILFHYPRLETMHGPREAASTLSAPLQQMRLDAAFRALPVTDPADGETVLCFRTYLPA
ncbi:MAG: hypothetical protein PW789_08950 [Edaphobacter sp.]|uniref:hypothetical protein n=1 Tax=Edaphobacter sp. TaxID=1934404 RepID=UPI0023897C1B|nr:hypothetical protein [Edaphobacter sp.]MDE1176724.1 hypothetical protein [Edaphobacter sp.]